MTSGSVTIPILLYHSIGRDARPGDRFTVPLSRFEAHMGLLRERACESLTVPHLADLLKSNRPLPPRPVAVTFDDYADFAKLARPVLERHGIACTLYATTGQIGSPGMLTWDQLAEAGDREWRSEGTRTPTRSWICFPGPR